MRRTSSCSRAASRRRSKSKSLPNGNRIHGASTRTACPARTRNAARERAWLHADRTADRGRDLRGRRDHRVYAQRRFDPPTRCVGGTYARVVGGGKRTRSDSSDAIDSDTPMPTGTMERQVTMGGREWRVEIKVTDTSNPWLRRADIGWRTPKRLKRRSNRLTGFVGRY